MFCIYFIYFKIFSKKNVLSAFELQPATTPVCPISLSANAVVSFKGKQIGVKVIGPIRYEDLGGALALERSSLTLASKA